MMGWMRGKLKEEKKEDSGKRKEERGERNEGERIISYNSWERDSALACSWAVTDPVICDS